MANLIFTGMVGSGAKLTAEEAAGLLGRKYVDTDEVLVRNMGITLHDIYTLLPINTFNELTLRLANQLSSCGEYVIAVGDSILTNPDAIGALAKTGFVIYIRQPLEDIMASDIDAEHPLLLRGRRRIPPLFQEREKILISSSDVIIDYSESAARSAVSVFNAHAQTSWENKLSENTGKLSELIRDRAALLSSGKVISDDFIRQCISRIDEIILKEFQS